MPGQICPGKTEKIYGADYIVRFIVHVYGYTEDTATNKAPRGRKGRRGVWKRSVFGMIKMAVLAPRGIFEDEEVRAIPTFGYEEPVRVLLHDDFARDCDEAV